MKSSPLLEIDVTSVSATQIPVDDSFQITVAIDNSAPCDLSCDSIWLTLAETNSDTFGGTGKRLANLRPKVTRQISASSLDNRFVPNLPSIKKQPPPSIDLRTHFEGSFDSPVAAGIACVNSHQLLRRTDSFGAVKTPVEDKVVKDTQSQRAVLSNVVLKSGENTIQFNFEV